MRHRICTSIDAILWELCGSSRTLRHSSCHAIWVAPRLWPLISGGGERPLDVLYLHLSVCLSLSFFLPCPSTIKISAFLFYFIFFLAWSHLSQ
ncbi:hypothetical protein BDV26DRAFT_54000 [Aspergillus bertholletiae]|uniref:Uncharacterized protein n=1 Tax=Aspergillus bertholletiae TaxID=1226010 RepID=A0A5N7AYT0_9EURO|nr:hypothetical protein BDV26DRAFT_54000 [Aspergillus bertholletiae]